MDVTDRPAEADPDRWCDWCGALITAKPIALDGLRFCGFKCTRDYQAAPPRGTARP